jgi:tetratricopeptide (TPR) repeat protein
VNSFGNLELADRIAELGMTELEMADALNTAIEDATGCRGRISDRYIRHLLSGRVQWPWQVTRDALEAVCDMSVLDLGFVPRERSSSRPAHPARTLSALREGDAVERREVLGVVGGVVMIVMVPSLPVRGRLGMTDVARLRAPLTQLIEIDTRLGGVDLATVASDQAQRILGALERCDMASRVQTAMYALAGEYLATAGWFSIDADNLTAAGDYLDQALRAASIARDPFLQAQIWNYMAMRARQARAFTEAHAVARAGLGSSAARRNPKVAALFHARVAHGHAFRGEYGLATRSLGRAQAALSRVKDDIPTPSWLAFVNEAELDGLAAIAFNALGKYEKAEEIAQRDLGVMPSTFARNRVHVVLHLAEARLGRREIEHAADDAYTALALAGHMRAGLQTGRVASRLRGLRRQFDRWSTVPAAHEWVSAYDAMTAAA